MQKHWDRPSVQAADVSFTRALEGVRSEQLRIELLAAYEKAVNAAADV